MGELAPYDEDWFYIRAASVARKVYLRKGTGVGALKKWYGGSSGSHVGTCKAHFSTASGAIIRKAMLELEKLEMMEHCSDGGLSSLAKVVLRWIALLATSV